MIIYIVRHEDRTQDATMFSPLTKSGLKNSNNLIKVIDDLNINFIYSSPYIRTLQTIYPFSEKSKLKINIDYGLSEIQHPDLIPPNSYKVALPKYLAEKFNYNENYLSTIKPTEYNFPEKSKDLNKRVKTIMKKIFNNHKDSKDSIIISTHQGICNTILKIIEKTGKTKLKNITNKYKYPKGKITKIFDTDKWVFKPINWEY
jgi:Fructose-2,6-bisphosphatase